MIGLIGVNHHTAKIDERSAFALSGAEAGMLIEDWIACGFLRGAVILSTCNRVEIYYDVDTECLSSTENKLIHSFLSNLELSPRYVHLLDTKRNEAVYQHLFRLAAGLESMVIGETQILGQLKEAYRMASLAGYCTGNLSRLFHRAFEVAKRIRSEYIVSATPLSAGSVAVDKLFATVQSVGRVLIVGAGVMSDTIYDHLVYKGHQDIVVYNRTRERAERFAETHPKVRVACEGELPKEIQQAAAIIVATSAPSPIILPEHVLEEYGNKVVIDLAVPRNVASDVEKLKHITLIGIDELSELGLALDEMKLQEISNIISEYVEAHKLWVDGAQMREVIATIQQATYKLLDKELGHLPNSLSDKELGLIKQWDEHFRTTISTAIVSSLREVTEDGRKQKYSHVIQSLFQHILNK